MRKAIIIVLLVLTLGTGYLLANSFEVGHAIPQKTVDWQEISLTAWTYRGSAIFFAGKFPPHLFSPDSGVLGDTPLSPDVAHDLREMFRGFRRNELFTSVLSDPIFTRGSSATRFGLVLPFRAPTIPSRMGISIGYAVFPLWCPLIIFAAYPTIAFVRGPLRSRRRARRGQCRNCGYDLTGNVSGVCPECGKEI